MKTSFQMNGHEPVQKAERKRAPAQAKPFLFEKGRLDVIVKGSMDLADKYIAEGRPLTWK